MGIEEVARLFATAAHGATGQKRKYTNTPYIEHPKAVVEILKEFNICIPEVLAAAWLHDVVEDTQITLQEIEVEFGPVVAQYVDYLSDLQTPEDGNRATRKQRTAERIATATGVVQSIKYADLIHNGESIVDNDPRFARVFLKEMRELLLLATEGKRDLWDRAWWLLGQWEKENNAYFSSSTQREKNSEENSDVLDCPHT